jgi:uncharacterized protein (TIGR02118 family)
LIKVLLLFGNPVDKKNFDEHFEKTNLPLIVQVPRVDEVLINRVAGAAVGDSLFHLIVELHFTSQEAMQEGLNSEIGQKMAGDFNKFASGGVTVLFCQSSKI